MSEALIDRIKYDVAIVASADVHRAYIAQGTKDRYLVPEEMLDVAAGHAERAHLPQNVGAFTPEQLRALDWLAAQIEEREDELLPDVPHDAFAAFILDAPAWIALRATAAGVLRTFGMEAPERLTAADIDGWRTA